MKLKICGISDVRNMLEVAEFQPDLMGFIFYPPSPRYMLKSLLPSDLDFLPEGIKKVGVFVNEKVDEVIRLSSLYKLDFIQLHGNENTEDCRRIKENGKGVIKAFNVDRDMDFSQIKEYSGVTDYFLFDSVTRHHGGSGKKFSWDTLSFYQLEHPFFLSGGIGPEDAEAIKGIEVPGFSGIDINSRFESGPGIKDTEMIKIFIEKLRNK